MSHETDPTRGPWPAAEAAAMVGADPARRMVQTVEGPTLHDREIGFGRGLASSDRSPTCNCRSSRASARSFGPGRPSTRLAARMLGVLALALVATGCGGSPEALMNTPQENAAPAPAPDATLAGDTGATDQPGVNEISSASAKVGEPVKVSAITPKKFAKAHCADPIMVVFYQPESILDSELYGQAKAAAKGVDDLVTLVYTPKDVKSFGDLPSKLGLLTTPGVATVGRDGTIENFWTTYVDSALIHRSLLNAEKSKPCKVSSNDVPAAGSALVDATTVANGGTVKNTTVDPLTGTPPGTPAVDAAGAVDPATGLPAASTTPDTTLAAGATTPPL